ncbi:protein DEPP1 [Discoglossus pictus]
MRSQLLISVAHLPTISEDAETKPLGEGPVADIQTSNGLDEYVKSIQTLAQPSSLSMDLLQQGLTRSQRRTRLRLRSSPRVFGPAQDNLPAMQANADPLAWLYRGKENQDCEEIQTPTPVTLPQTVYPASHLRLYKTTESIKRQPCNKDQASEQQRPQEKRVRAQRFQKKSRPTGYSSRGANRLQRPQLPVIYEL